MDPGLSDAKATQSQLMAQQMAVGDGLHFAFINSVTSASKIGSVSIQIKYRIAVISHRVVKHLEQSWYRIGSQILACFSYRLLFLVVEY